MTSNFPKIKAESFFMTLKYPNVYAKTSTSKSAIISKYPNVHVESFTIASTFPNNYKKSFMIDFLMFMLNHLLFFISIPMFIASPFPKVDSKLFII